MLFRGEGRAQYNGRTRWSGRRGQRWKGGEQRGRQEKGKCERTAGSLRERAQTMMDLERHRWRESAPGTNAPTEGTPHRRWEEGPAPGPTPRSPCPFYSGRGPRTAAGVDETRVPAVLVVRTAPNHHHHPPSWHSHRPAVCCCWACAALCAPAATLSRGSACAASGGPALRRSRRLGDGHLGPTPAKPHLFVSRAPF